MLGLGLFAYEHHARSLCCHIKRERCFLQLSHVSKVDRYQTMVCSALLGQMGNSHLFPRAASIRFSSAPLYGHIVSAVHTWESASLGVAQGP